MTDRRISKLVAWYKQHKRDLPWRNTRNPYRIFVSELMLQQTQVDRVIDFYKRWLKKFPTWTSLANATTPELLHAWAGLGYNRRALMLREAARHVVAHGVPSTVDAWQALKGVGPYTAAAVHAITARKRLVVIDTNVRRVAGRLFLGKPYPGLSDDPKIAKTLNQTLPARDTYWEFPQMLMDFGTAVCTPKDPACAACPLRNECRAAQKFLHGTAGKKPRIASRERKHRDKPHPDRIYRGRILAAVRDGRVRTIHALGVLVDASFDHAQDDAWLRAMVARLVRDGMIAQHGAQLSLPKK